MAKILKKIEEAMGVFLCEIIDASKERSEQSPRRYYVVSLNRKAGKVGSIVPEDRPKNGGNSVADFSIEGIEYVSKGRSRQTARRWYATILKQREAYEFLKIV